MERLMVNDTVKKSRLPARLDLLQSGTGLVLGLFMWAHMCLVASILLGKGMFNFVAKTMELSFLSSTGHGYPAAVFVAVTIVFSLFILHAALAVRKFPITWKQHEIIRSQMGMLKHEDTNLWYIQFITGFIMFFLGSVHLYIMWSNPGQIDPYLSADRFVSHSMWPLYLVLLVSVELHGTIGLYRLCMKWGWFGGKNPRQSRTKLKKLKNQIGIAFLAVGLLAFAVFVIIGIGHMDEVGQRYASHTPAVEEPVAPAADVSHEADTHSEEKAAPAEKTDSHAAETSAHEAKADSHAAQTSGHDGKTDSHASQSSGHAKAEPAHKEATHSEPAHGDDAHSTTAETHGDHHN